MSAGTQIRDAIMLMRPGQWPILSAQFFLSVMLVSPRALGGGCWLNGTSLLVLALGWLLWVVFLNGGTLAFNSAYDRDTGPVAYLDAPPVPPKWLSWASALLMGLATVLAGLVMGLALATVLGGCFLLSVLYSHPAARLKSRPGWDLVINMVGYGAATTLAGILTGLAANLGLPAGACPTDSPNILAFPQASLPILQGPLSAQLAEAVSQGRLPLVLGFGLLFGSFYPNTQIYQAAEDSQRGDRTLTTALGPSRALVLAVVLGLGSGLMFFQAWQGCSRPWPVALPMAAIAVWVGHQAYWCWKVKTLDEDQNKQLMYRSLALWAVTDAAVLIGWFSC